MRQGQTGGFGLVANTLIVLVTVLVAFGVLALINGVGANISGETGLVVVVAILLLPYSLLKLAAQDEIERYRLQNPAASKAEAIGVGIGRLLRHLRSR